MVIWPTGSEKKPLITDHFGPREPIYIPGQGWTSAFHYGTDIPQPYGFRWRAPFAGKVIYSGTYGGWGNIVVVEGKVGRSRVQAAILHAAAKGLAKSGSKVKQDQEIATCSDTGQAVGPHTCFRIWVNGNWKTNSGVVDAEKWIPKVNRKDEEDMAKIHQKGSEYIISDPRIEGGGFVTKDKRVATAAARLLLPDGGSDIIESTVSAQDWTDMKNGLKYIAPPAGSGTSASSFALSLSGTAIPK